MIDLYVIINQEIPIETYIRLNKNRRKLQSIIKWIIKKIKDEQSKVIKKIKIQDYIIYYFKQDNFIFALATILQNKIQRIQNYLRVIAQIFYQNYDQKKFHYILDKLIDQINRNDLGTKKQNRCLEDQQCMLVQSNIIKEKIKLNSLIQKREKQSVRAYVVMAFLIISIVVMICVYLFKKIE